jgi:Protein of unknown function (DUF3531)
MPQAILLPTCPLSSGLPQCLADFDVPTCHLITSDRFGTSMQMWLELYSTPGDKEKGILEQVIQSWFIVGRVGGYDATNLQVPLPPCARARDACVSAEQCPAAASRR